jgi:Proton-conducting membrane transporter/NADH-Ubiquinone oxidoreductase (complex I), chain 5 N-terminus/Group II intron, maturase-specific domain
MYVSIIFLPFLAAIISGFFGRAMGVKGVHIFNLSCLSLTTILAFVAFFEVVFSNSPVSIELFTWISIEQLNVTWSFYFDELTVSMLIPVLIVSLLVHFYSVGYMDTDPHQQRFFCYISLFTGLMLVLVTGNNFLVMFIGWEGVGVCSYLLVHFWYTRVAAVKSALNAMFTNRVGDYCLTLGFFAIFFTFGSLDFATVFSIAPYININIITFIALLLLLGATAKSAQLGLHAWLPMAMVRQLRHFTNLLIIHLLVISKIILSINQLDNELTRLALINELRSKVLGISIMCIKPNSNIKVRVTDLINLLFYYILVRFESSVLYSSLTRVNCHFKTGSIGSRVFIYKGQWKIHRVFVGLILLTTPVQTRTRNNNQITSSKILKAGNLRKIYKYILEISVFFNDLLLFKITNILPRFYSQGIYYWAGGKIIDEANASSNVDDNIFICIIIHLLFNTNIYFNLYNNRILFSNIYINNYSKCINYNIYNKYNRYILRSQRLNSILFTRSDNIIFVPRYYSNIPYREVIPSRVYYSNIPYREVIPSKVGLTKYINNKYTLIVMKKQNILSEIAEKFNIYDNKIIKLQGALALSLEFRLLAVSIVYKKLIINKIKPINKKIDLQNNNEILIIVEDLRNILITVKHNQAYMSTLVKNKSYLNDSINKHILSMKDKCLQELFLLILFPVIKSFILLRYKTPKSAIIALEYNINNKYILNGTNIIKRLFKKNNREWLIKYIPLSKYHKIILNNWLKLGLINKSLSSLLINFIFSGLEEFIYNSIKYNINSVYPSGPRDPMGICLDLKCIRYDKDFIILGKSKRILVKYVRPAIVKFFNQRGLELYEDKVKIYSIKKESLDFLGYRFKYQEKWNKYYKGKSGIIIYPDNSNLLNIRKKLKNVIRKSYNSDAYNLILKLNPLIKQWSNYYNLGASKYYRNKLRFYLYKLCWKWASRKHPKWGKKRLAKFYFLNSLKTDNRKWLFRGISKNNTVYLIDS